jgi:hypothetical protein
MRKVARFLVTATCGFLALATLGCGEGDIHETDSGGVIIVVSDFNGRPNAVSVGASANIVVIDSLTLQSNLANPTGGSSNLMDTEISSYEVTFTRADSGTRLPPSLVRQASFYVPAGGTADIINLPILLSPQLGNLPLSDLANFGIDRETGSSVILLNVSVRFFGRTIGGRELDTSPFRFTVEFRP